MVDGPQHARLPISSTATLPSCLRSRRTFPSLPGSRLTIFYRDTGLALLCVCVLSILDVRLVDVPAGVTQKEGHTGFLHLPSARRFQPSLFFVDREVKFCVLTHTRFSTCWALFIYLFIFVRKNPRSCDCTEIRTHVPTSEGFEVTN